METRQPLAENVLACLDLESRFYAVLSKAASSGLASNPRRSKSREPKRPKGRESVRISRKDRNGILTPGRYIMNEFTDKNEQAFLDACGAISVEPGWKLKSCITLTQRRYGHPEGVNLTTLMRGSYDSGVAAPHCDRYGHVKGIDPKKKVADEAIVVR